MTITVKQGEVEAELSVPNEKLISDFPEVWREWEQHDKFVLASEVASGMVLQVDGVDISWDQVWEMAETPFATLMDGVASAILVLPKPVEPIAVIQKLPLVTALDEPQEALDVHVATTVAEIKALLRKGYDGDLDGTLVQMRGRNGTSFLSIKLSTMTDESAAVMDVVAARAAAAPALLRPQIPKEISELRLKLAMGVAPMIVAAPAPADAADGSFREEVLQKVSARSRSNDPGFGFGFGLAPSTSCTPHPMAGEGLNGACTGTGWQGAVRHAAPAGRQWQCDCHQLHAACPRQWKKGQWRQGEPAASL